MYAELHVELHVDLGLVALTCFIEACIRVVVTTHSSSRHRQRPHVHGATQRGLFTSSHSRAESLRRANFARSLDVSLHRPT